MSNQDRPVVFVVPGDLHLTERGLENHRVGEWMVEEVNRLIRPDFVQFIGDNVQDATPLQFELFQDLCLRIEVPHYALVGDHDIANDPTASLFREMIGATYGASTIGGLRFLRLNSQEGRPVGFSAEQMEWLRDQLRDAAQLGQRIIVFQHNYPYQIWEDYDGPGVDDWRGLVQSHRLQALFCGHTHYFQAANDGRNVSIAVRSIGDPEGGAPGYLVGVASGERLAFRYRSVDESGPLALITHPRESLFATTPRHIVTGRDQVEVRVWSIAMLRSVQGRLNGGEWAELAPSAPRTWIADLPGDELEKGEHHFEARAIDVSGRQSCHEINFVVDPTGRYTAVPASRPRVIQTAFC